MDTITHGVAGALIGKALFDKRDSRWATLSVTLGSIFPDSDTLANLFYRSDMAMLQIHRGVTHSLLMLPVFSLIFGWVTAKALRRPDHWLRYSQCFGIGIVSHIFFDLITSYGTMIWSPLSNRRVAWDITFIIDLIFSSIVLLPQLLAWTYSDREFAKKRGVITWLVFTLGGIAVSLLTRLVGVYISGWTIVITSVLVATLVWLPSIDGRGFLWPRTTYCRVGVASLALYLAGSAVTHAIALRQVEAFAKSSAIATKDIAALPAPPSTFQWSGLIETDRGVYRAPLHLMSGEAPSFSFFPNSEENGYLQKVESLPDVKTYLWFARFPWKTMRVDDGMPIVEIRDIQFFFPQRSRNTPFTYRVSFDLHGNIVAAGLLGR